MNTWSEMQFYAIILTNFSIFMSQNIKRILFAFHCMFNYYFMTRNLKAIFIIMPNIILN